MDMSLVGIAGWIGAGLLGLIVVYCGLLAFGAMLWSRSMVTLVTRLQAGREPRLRKHYDAGDLAGLPAPVQRYFRAVLTDGQRIVTGVRLAQSGDFNLGTVADRWASFTATQHFATRAPGFVWDARIAMFPGVPVRVVDAFVGGEGLLRPTILGLWSLGTLQGRGEIARGELLRYLAESVWFPTALLPSEGVEWEPVDDRAAIATLRAGPVGVTMVFRFDEDGLVQSVFVSERATKVGNVAVMMPWECRLGEYQMQGGMRVPLWGEAISILPEGPHPYFRGRITSISYAFAE
jgi:hypothetical protein